MAQHNIFKTGKMMSKHIDSYLKNVVHATADLDNGNVVIITGLVSGATDTYTVTAPATVTAEEVFIIDEPVRNLIDGQYAIDVSDPRAFYVPATRVCRARKLAHGDTCYISAAGISGSPVVGEYVVPANGAVKLAAAANLSQNTLVAFQIKATENFYVGTETVSGYKLEVVVSK